MEIQDMGNNLMDFVNSYSFKDKKEVYTNGAELVPIFRVRQAYDYHFLKLEKALDKACKIMTNRVNIDSGNGKPTIGFTEKEWKEWLMNNETI